ncbi:MAG: hypothetical protein HN348_11490, partial [Proteobacteria bacterium]|nr:hypothetical protein [Pseudomonadota bacterium]
MLLGILALLGFQSALAVPTQLRHQARLMDATGVPLVGAHEITFSLYEDATSSSPLWEENQQLDFTNGYFTATLGEDSSNPVDATIMENEGLFLAISVDGGPEMERLELHSAPYAIVAGTAIDLEGGSVDATDIRVNGQLVIDSDGTLLTTSDTLAELLCFNGEVAKYDGSQWDCATDDLLQEGDVEDYVANDAIDLHQDTTVDGEAISTGAHTIDTWLSDGEVDAYVENGPLNLAAGTQLDGQNLQLRVSDECSVGSSLRAIYADGTVACETATELGEQAVENYITNGAIDLHPDTTIDGADISTGAHMTDTTLSDGEVDAFVENGP